MAQIWKILFALVFVVLMVEATRFKLKDCNIGPTVGRRQCKAYFPKFTWNNDRQECEEIVYGGCKPSKNNFKTMEDCETIAKPVCYNLL